MIEIKAWVFGRAGAKRAKWWRRVIGRRLAATTPFAKRAEEQAATIDYYVWLLSDWAYLGGVRFVQLAARHGLKINHIPMRMQNVYAGSGGIVLANRAWQRQAYRIAELKRWRSRLGIHVNIEPKFFPADVDLASCVVIAGQRGGWPVADFVNAIMRAIWAEDQDVSDSAVLLALAGRAGWARASRGGGHPAGARGIPGQHGSRSFCWGVWITILCV